MKVFPTATLSLVALTAGSLSALDLMTEYIELLNPAAVCKEMHQVRQDTVLYSDCTGFDYINQRVVKDSMLPADFAKFLADYQLGDSYTTTADQPLLNWLEAVISPFDPATRVSHDGSRFLFRTKSSYIVFEFTGSEWQILTAALAPN
ncbi:hypothetical protein ABC502_14895 [Alkalimonas sp. NCh-2]|uniref:hypothetical protein n=1 Tax=Alkalimonas sp. NCh-2 TaxID=3144846 RepID=UPI0031F648C4